MSLFSRHNVLAQTAYSGLKRRAVEQGSLLVGTPGSVDARDVNGAAFYYRQFYDAEGKKAAEYIGPVRDPAAEDRAAAVRLRIEEANDLLREARQVVALGYLRADVRAAAILGALANRDLFRAGAVLVGTHAYTVLLNDLGVRADSVLTEDVDVARADRLDVALPEGMDFGQILRESRLEMHAVPGFGRHAPSTSFKIRGAGRLRVDLLAPARGREVSVRDVPELGAHATALPFFGYVLEAPLPGIVIGRTAVVPVQLPRPERMAWHKILVSELRGATREKRGKDLQQAAVLIAVLAEDAPDALAEAWSDLPRGTRGMMKNGLSHVARLVSQNGHGQAVSKLTELLSKTKNR